jgi:carbohydrate kinase (thermoresistant glucokinase family)
MVKPWEGLSRDRPRVVAVIGVSGAGKTTVGRQLADQLCWNFAEGDTLHPSQNLAKMRSGQPLTDTDRAPWLAAVGQVIDGWISRGECGVITCSGLKRSYRRQIISDHRIVQLVYLEGPRELIAERLAPREDHFMPVSLLDSQFATLEPPGPDESPITVGIDRPVDEIVDHIIGVISSSA